MIDEIPARLGASIPLKITGKRAANGSAKMFMRDRTSIFPRRLAVIGITGHRLPE
jgi:hypothetical protein